MERVLMGVDLALQLGYDPVKINCVVMKGRQICTFVIYIIYKRFVNFFDLAKAFDLLSNKLCIQHYFLGFNDDEVVDFVKLTEHKNLDVRFIEYMPFSGNKWEVDKMVPYNTMLSKIRSVWPDFTPLANKPNDTSKVGKILKIFLFRISWNVFRLGKSQVLSVRSVSSPRCQTCFAARATG